MFFKKVQRDERAISIENKSYKYGYAIFNFGLLIDILYRSSIHNEAPHDLFALLVVAGLFVTAYQYKEKIFTPEWKTQYLLLIGLSAVAGVVSVVLFKLFG